MQIATDAEVHIAAPPEAVFDHLVDMRNVTQLFQGFGPVPHIVRAELVGAEMVAVGVRRRVHLSDGSILDEDMVFVDRPYRHGYRLLRGFRPPNAWIVRDGMCMWTLVACDAGRATRLTCRFDFTLRTPLVWLAGRLQIAFVRRAVMRSLATIRGAVEAGIPRVTAAHA